MRKIKVEGGYLLHGDCLKHMARMKPRSVDLVFGSPPYEAQREYGELKFDLKGQDWVDWMVKVFEASLRVCKGLVAFVVGHGVQENYKWSATPALLIADLHRKGICLRNPKWYKRYGIMGSGGKDDLRKDVEFIVCATNGGRLPWSDNKACGEPWKFKPGGEISHREKDGKRVNERKFISGYKNGDLEYKTAKRAFDLEAANPGDVIDCGAVGGGHLGAHMAHENEAPFPEKLSDFFIRSFCKPNGWVYDPFGGSGTTLASAIKTGRRFVCSDIRLSQIKLMLRRAHNANDNKGFFQE